MTNTEKPTTKTEQKKAGSAGKPMAKGKNLPVPKAPVKKEDTVKSVEEKKVEIKEKIEKKVEENQDDYEHTKEYYDRDRNR